MEIKLFYPDSLLPKPFLKEFLQKMTNRLGFGEAQYGKAQRRQCYMTRLGKEYAAYKKTGNAEHLYNIANYAYLESIAPENPKFHEDNTVSSVTRASLGK